jgi:hypothetical protein
MKTNNAFTAPQPSPSQKAGGGCLERLVRHIAQMAPHQKDRDGGRLIIEAAGEMESLQCELQAYRDGGVTEEILRRNNGYIKVGRGCVIALESDMPNEKS